jgi:hypothetical protein
MYELQRPGSVDRLEVPQVSQWYSVMVLDDIKLHTITVT